MDLIDLVTSCNDILNEVGIKIDGFKTIYETDDGIYLFPWFSISNKDKYNLYDFKYYEEEELADIIHNKLENIGISACCYAEYWT